MVPYYDKNKNKKGFFLIVVLHHTSYIICWSTAKIVQFFIRGWGGEILRLYSTIGEEYIEGMSYKIIIRNNNYN